jgi:hypothetical protein
VRAAHPCRGRGSSRPSVRKAAAIRPASTEDPGSAGDVQRAGAAGRARAAPWAPRPHAAPSRRGCACQGGVPAGVSGHYKASGFRARHSSAAAGVAPNRLRRRQRRTQPAGRRWSGRRTL